MKSILNKLIRQNSDYRKMGSITSFSPMMITIDDQILSHNGRPIISDLRKRFNGNKYLER